MQPARGVAFVRRVGRLLSHRKHWGSILRTQERTEVMAYPLTWPEGWKRHPFSRERARFGTSSAYQQSREVLAELERMGVGDWSVVISTNVALRNDGLPRVQQPTMNDPGAAVYFTLDGERHALACDCWDRVEHNLRAIAKHIEAMRGMNRWGVGSVAQAFSGYKALPAPEDPKTWWSVLGLDMPPTRLEDAKAAYRKRAMVAHPDRGGSAEAFEVLRSAWSAAQSAFRPKGGAS